MAEVVEGEVIARRTHGDPGSFRRKNLRSFARLSERAEGGPLYKTPHIRWRNAMLRRVLETAPLPLDPCAWVYVRIEAIRNLELAAWQTRYSIGLMVYRQPTFSVITGIV